MAFPASFLDHVQLTVVRALLGAIRPEMRAVTVALEGRAVLVRVFHEGPVTPALAETISEVDTEIRAAYPADGAEAITLETVPLRYDTPTRLPALGLPVFSRFGVQYDHAAAAERP